MCVCVCACVRACVRACVCVSDRVCECTSECKCWANVGPMSKIMLGQRMLPTLAQCEMPMLVQRWSNIGL